MIFFDLLLVSLTVCLAQFAQSVAVKGATGGVDTSTGQRPFRQEFSTFATSGPAFDLYLLSLQQFQEDNQADLLSYFQVSGIHGRPYIPWDGVQGFYQAGYCTHGSILFPSWHRAYVALFEQIIWSNAQQIAATYPNMSRSQYQAAAQTLRIPYWDWAVNATMPSLLNQPMVSINTPSGVKDTRNPLLTYAFHPQPSTSDFPPSDGAISKYPNTVRYPDDAGQSQPELANRQLQSNAQALHDLTYQLIADQSDYAPFSNTGYSDGRGGQYNSIENMHNAIHSLVGNGGHMSIVPYAAFDPIFWLHHANVDRLIAIWQAIYPESYTTSQVNAQGTFTDAPGAAEDVNTALTPFHSDNNSTLYTSTTARYTRTFGYTYPEVIDWGVSPAQLSANVRTNLNKLYNPTGSIAIKKRAMDTSRTPPYPFPNITDYQYFVNIRVDKSALNASFFVHFFLGEPTTVVNEYSFAPNLIASHSVLSIHPAGPSLDTGLTTAMTYGQIPLNHALVSPGNIINNSTNITDLSPASVIPFLTKSLTWKIQKYNDELVPAGCAELDTLRIFVVGRLVTYGGGAEDEFPDYGRLEMYREVTMGKDGGIRAGDGM
ncbi:MAG: hypothetical protein Q9163_001981 [Psora crenata]